MEEDCLGGARVLHLFHTGLQEHPDRIEVVVLHRSVQGRRAVALLEACTTRIGAGLIELARPLEHLLLALYVAQLRIASATPSFLAPGCLCPGVLWPRHQARSRSTHWHLKGLVGTLAGQDSRIARVGEQQRFWSGLYWRAAFFKWR